MIVMKFGGTSVEDAASMKNVVRLVEREIPKRPVVVVSAIAGATNALLRFAHLAFEGKLETAGAELNGLLERHVTILENLVDDRASMQAVLLLVRRKFEELRNLYTGIALLGELTPRSLDAIASFGELTSSMILAEGFRAHGMEAELINARTFLLTDDHFGNASPLLQEIDASTKREILPRLERGKLVVTQGYIGSTRGGVTSTLGRGGSDFTAALIGASLNATEIQIWTDVDGIMTADPHIIPAAKKLKLVSFREAAELAYFGAKVLHPSTILPAVQKNIPVVVLNSKKPLSTGTRILSDPPKSNSMIKSIASKAGITVINIRSTRMLMAYGFLESIFACFNRHKTPVDLVSTSEVAVSLTVDDASQLDAIVEELEQFAEVTVFPRLAIVCVVGEELRSTAGVAGRLFRALGDINVIMISQGASEINMSLVVEEQFTREAVRRLHQEFFERVPEPEIFESVLP
ncbi:MAG TPA: lysine-sensitive aspartokinase 3 [Bacteroidota bacterium]|nr:lysine-sensitive aspartokinase 3 [Bacteroidota bacterium]